MISTLISFIVALGFGLGISLTVYGSILGYQVFFEESPFDNPLIPMGVSFASITMGLTLLYFVLL